MLLTPSNPCNTRASTHHQVANYPWDGHESLSDRIVAVNAAPDAAVFVRLAETYALNNKAMSEVRGVLGGIPGVRGRLTDLTSISITQSDQASLVALPGA